MLNSVAAKAGKSVGRSDSALQHPSYALPLLSLTPPHNGLLSSRRLQSVPDVSRPSSGGVARAVLRGSQGIVILAALTLLPANVCMAAGPTVQSDKRLAWTVEQLSDGRERAHSPVIVADRTGVVHALWSQTTPEAGIEAIYYARHDGTSWSVSDVIVGKHVLRPVVGIDRQDRLHLVWMENGTLQYSNAPIAGAQSARSWAEPITIAYDKPLVPHLVVDLSDAFHLAYWTAYHPPLGVHYVRSTDGGKSWSSPTIFESPRVDAVAHLPQLAVGEDGTMHMVWSLLTTSNYHGGLGVYYVRSTDGGASWSDPVRLDEDRPDADGEGAWQASIATLGNDEVHVVWDAHSLAGRRRHTWSRDGGKTWDAAQPIWGTFVSQTGPNPMITDSAGTLRLFSAGTFDWNQRQGVYWSEWTGSNWTNPQLVDLFSDGPHHIDVALTGGNTLHLAWLAMEAEPRAIFHAWARTAPPAVAAKAEPPVGMLSPELSASPTVPSTQHSTTPVQTDTPGASVQLGQLGHPAHPLSGILAGVVPALVVITGGILFHRVWQRRR